MAILITGSRGFIGSLLHKEFPDAITIDIKDGLNLLSCPLPSVDVVYHLAAQSSVESSWKDPVHDMDNIRMTARLVEFYPNTKIVYASSAATLEPISSPYGFSKWASGEYLKRFHKKSVLCVFPNVYGAGSKSVVDYFKGKSKVMVYGDGKQTRDYVHVSDIVKGLVKARKWKSGEYFMGSGVSTTVLELAMGRDITFLPPRKEAREVSMHNTTPNWHPIIKVKDYIHA